MAMVIWESILMNWEAFWMIQSGLIADCPGKKKDWLFSARIDIFI